jgi:hypothetical protein
LPVSLTFVFIVCYAFPSVPFPYCLIPHSSLIHLASSSSMQCSLQSMVTWQVPRELWHRHHDRDHLPLYFVCGNGHDVCGCHKTKRRQPRCALRSEITRAIAHGAYVGLVISGVLIG